MHILIVSHYYPPLNAIASFRPASFAKFLVESDVKVTVLTTHKHLDEGGMDLDSFSHPLLKVIEVPYKPLKFWKKAKDNQKNEPVNPSNSTNNRLQTNSRIVKVRKWLVTSLGSLVDYQFFWRAPAVRKAIDIHKNEPVDLVLSSFGPPAAHLIAASFKSKFPEVKWLADYRDLWSNNHLFVPMGVFKLLQEKVEKKIVSRSNYITTVSQPLADDLYKLFEQKIPVSVIFNGFESDGKPLQFAKSGKLKFPLQIVYTGTIYKDRRDPGPLFTALNELKQEGVLTEQMITVNFYGAQLSNLEEIVEAHDALKWVKIHGQVNHQKSKEVQKNADFLLHLESLLPDARGVLTGKLFEYMITGNPILAVGVDEKCASAQVINDTQSGVVFGNNIALLKAYFREILKERAVTRVHPRMDEILKYSREEQARKLLRIISSIINKG